MTHPAGRVESHSNQFHVGCPTGPDTVQVVDGTYAVQFEENNTGVRRVLVTSTANREAVIAILRAHARVRSGRSDVDGINENLRLIASGAKVPDSVVEGTLRAATSCSGVDADLKKQALYYHPEEVRYRAEVARVLAWVKENLSTFVTQNERDGNIVVLLPKSLGTPHWKTLFDHWGKEDGRLNLVRGVAEPVAAEGLPDWAVAKLLVACERAKICTDIYHVIDNMKTATKLAVTIFEKPSDFFSYPRRGEDVLLHNGQDPNVGFGRVQWNRWFFR